MPTYTTVLPMRDWDAQALPLMREYVFRIADFFGHDTCVYVDYEGDWLEVVINPSEHFPVSYQQDILNQLIVLREQVGQLYCAEDFRE